jgi:hypothetical protein
VPRYLFQKIRIALNLPQWLPWGLPQLLGGAVHVQAESQTLKISSAFNAQAKYKFGKPPRTIAAA